MQVHCVSYTRFVKKWVVKVVFFCSTIWKVSDVLLHFETWRAGKPHGQQEEEGVER